MASLPLSKVGEDELLQRGIGPARGLLVGPVLIAKLCLRASSVPNAT